MSSETLTHKDLGELCGVSVTTIKSYRKKFGGFIPVATQGKPIRFLPEAGPVCLRIRDSFAEGLSIEETRKRLRAEFKEIEAEKKVSTSDDSATPSVGANPVSGEYMEQFFKTAGQMMQGMAQLATAQARADQRLSRLEKALTGLLESGAATQDALGELIEQVRTVPAGENRVRARKIVSVHGAEGKVDTYSFDAETADEDGSGIEADHNAETGVQPDGIFLTFPVAVHSERGEFLGVPGRLSLGEFADLLLDQSGDNARSFWREADDFWILVLTQGDGQRNELFFERTKTPRGNDVALLGRLDVDGRETSHAFLLEFFRQVKDRMRRDA